MSNLLEQQEHVIAALEGGAAVVHSIYLDLARAFDCCPFRLIVKRLKEAGVTSNLLRYVDRFLRGRQF